jgi:hypothetical protein
MEQTSWSEQPPFDNPQYSPVASPSPPGGDPGTGRRRALRWTAGIAAAVVLSAGGVVAGMNLAGSQAPASPPPNSQAGILSSALKDAASSNASSSTSPTATAPRTRALRLPAVLRRLRGVHGEFTVHTRTGFREIAFERGVITTISSSQVTVRAIDGTTWAWTFTSSTVVRKDGTKSAPSSLAAGDRLFVGGPQTGSVRDARLIVVPKNPAPGQSSPRQHSASPAPTAAPGTTQS